MFWQPCLCECMWVCKHLLLHTCRVLKITQNWAKRMQIAQEGLRTIQKKRVFPAISASCIFLMAIEAQQTWLSCHWFSLCFSIFCGKNAINFFLLSLKKSQSLKPDQHFKLKNFLHSIKPLGKNQQKIIVMPFV